MDHDKKLTYIHLIYLFHLFAFDVGLVQIKITTNRANQISCE